MADINIQGEIKTTTPVLVGTLSENNTPVTGTLSSNGAIEGALSSLGLRGYQVELKQDNESIYWKYSNENETEWKLLINLDITDYEMINNKPRINSIELMGDRDLNELGIQAQGNYIVEEDIEPLSNIELEALLK